MFMFSGIYAVVFLVHTVSYRICQQNHLIVFFVANFSILCGRICTSIILEDANQTVNAAETPI